MRRNGVFQKWIFTESGNTAAAHGGEATMMAGKQVADPGPGPGRVLRQAKERAMRTL